MRKNKFFVLLAMFCLLLIGCGQASKEHAQPNTAKTYTVVDATGRKVNFAAKPQRIISMGLSGDEILLDLVEPKRLAALTSLVDDPSISPCSDKAKVVQARVKGRGAEGILALQPDLVIIPSWMEMKEKSVLEDAGIKVFIIDSPHDFAGIKKLITTLGAVTGEAHRAKQIDTDIEQKLAVVWQAVSQVPDNKKQSILAFSQMGVFGAKGTSFDEICHKANVINALGEYDLSKNATINKEQVVALNPDYFLLPSWDQSGRGDVRNYINDIQTDPAYKELKAVKNNHLISIDDRYLYSTSQYTVQAVEELARAVYPTAFQ